VASPEWIPEAGVQMTLAPGMSDGNLEDEFREFADDQIRSRPGQVSELHGEKKYILANFDLISASRIGKILFEELTRLSIRGTGPRSNSLTPIHSALCPMVNHPMYHQSS